MGKIQFNQDEYNKLLNDYKPGTDYWSHACKYVKDNEKTLRDNWKISKVGKSSIIIGGIFPFPDNNGPSFGSLAISQGKQKIRTRNLSQLSSIDTLTDW